MSKRPKQPTLEQLQQEVDDFNKKYPVGSSLKLRKDSGEIIDTTVVHRAIIAGGHSAVGWFENVSGYYLLKCVVE